MKDNKYVKKRAPNPHGISGGLVFVAYVEIGQQTDI